MSVFETFVLREQMKKYIYIVAIKNEQTQQF